jgi:TolB-like protein
MIRIAIVFILFILGAVTLQAQAVPDSERRVSVYDFTNYTEQTDEGASAAGTYSSLIADSLTMELERAGYLVVVPERAREARRTLSATSPAGTQPGSRAADSEMAASLGADVLVTGSYRLEDGMLFVTATAWDLFSSRSAASLFERGEAGTAVFETIDEIARKVAEKARSSLRPLTPAELVIRSERVKVENRVVEKVVELGTSIDITLRSPDEGAEVWLGDSLAGRIDKGQLVVSAKVGTPLAVRLRGKGLRESAQDFLVTEGKTVYQLRTCYRMTTFEMGPVWSVMVPLGASASLRYFAAPDALFAELQAGVGTATATSWKSKTRVLPGGGTSTAPVKTDLGSSLILGQQFNAGWYPLQDPTAPLRLAALVGIGHNWIGAVSDSGDEWLGSLGVALEYNDPRWAAGLTGRLQSRWSPSDIYRTVLFPIYPETAFASTAEIILEGGLRWKF